MATVQEVDEQLNVLEEELKAASKPDRLRGVADTFVVSGREYSGAQLRAYVANLKRDIKALTAVVKPYRDAKRKLESAQQFGPGQQPTQVQQNVIAKALRDFNRLSLAVVTVPTLITAPAFTGGAAPSAPVSGGTGAMGPLGPSGRSDGTGPMGPLAPSGGTGAMGALGPRDVRGGRVTTGATGAQATTGAGRGTGAGTGAGVGAGAPPPTTRADKNWERKFRTMFPAQSWMLDLDRTKYADVFALFQRASKQEMWKTAEGQLRFKSELQNTTFYKELDNKGVVQRIRSIAGDTGFEPAVFNRLIKDTVNLGWDDDTIKREVYAEAFRKDPTTGQYVNQVAQQRASKSSDYLSIANIGRQFFSTIDTATIEANLTGGLTVEDISRQQRELAKTKYQHLAPLIDQGFTLEALAADYKAMAARLLEKPETAIDMSQADYEQALNFNENGTKRIMTTGEWERLLKTDDRYGYGNTQQAQARARQIAMNLAMSIGGVR